MHFKKPVKAQQERKKLEARKIFELKPVLVDTEPVLLSRSGDTTTTPNLRTCEETWSENIVLIKNPGIDWQALRITGSSL